MSDIFKDSMLNEAEEQQKIAKRTIKIGAGLFAITMLLSLKAGALPLQTTQPEAFVPFMREIFNFASIFFLIGGRNYLINGENLKKKIQNVKEKVSLKPVINSIAKKWEEKGDKNIETGLKLGIGSAILSSFHPIFSMGAILGLYILCQGVNNKSGGERLHSEIQEATDIELGNIRDVNDKVDKHQKSKKRD